ncbi:MAG: EAL domain-containing protein [Helicobacteraceae bacterium]|nr:EAL domain-containing protein [Candidatus Sulfurimonas ponti]MBL6973664.1 EAL domain-containing protein [Sulfurimonas sp.]
MQLRKLIQTTKTFKLLYVEDDELSRLSVVELLGNFFDDVTVAIDGEDGLNKFKEKNFDIILSDINMPKLNGVDMLHEIRKFDKNVTALFLSAHNDNEYLAEGIRLSVDSFIVKPLSVDSLRLALSKVSEKILLKRENLNYRLDLENKIKEKTKELDTKLHFDELTGLHSRYSFFEDIKNDLMPIVFIIDINKFKLINQIYSIEVGTLVLKEFALLLKDFTSGTRYKVYRLSADEFVIKDNVLYVDTDKYESDMDRFFKKLSEFKVEIDNDFISIEVTVGVSTCQADAFECAKIALEYAKVHKKQSMVYSKEIDKRNEDQDALVWKNKTKSAIEDNRVVAVYQAIVDQNEKAIKYETLMRLKDKKSGALISPIHFLSIATQTGLYNTLSSIIIFEGLGKLAATECSLSFNFNYEDIINKSLLNEIESFFRTSPTLGEKAVFEITESELIEDYADIKDFIGRFRKYGVQFAIDDFGSGFSNFEYILEIDPDYLKIDGSLVKHIDTDEKSFILVNAIVEFSHRLGIKVIAEYVHSAIIFTMLKKLGVDEFQGFYFSEPLEQIG